MCLGIGLFPASLCRLRRVCNQWRSLLCGGEPGGKSGSRRGFPTLAFHRQRGEDYR
ncbi:MAG: hypothetical protein E7428_08265 [Ruminococcaceae bacterium]|nr:hypothetical protein [Oscillospiraceae bacterium]